MSGCGTNQLSTKPGDIKIGSQPVPMKTDPAEATAEEVATAVDAIYMSGLGYFEHREYGTALHEFERVVQLRPADFQAHLKIGLCYYQLERYSEEIEAYKRSIAANPNYLDAHLNLAHALLSREELQPALTEYREVIRLDSNHPLAHYNAGLINIDMSRFDEALKHLEKAQDLQKLLTPGAQEKIKVYMEKCKIRMGK